MVVGLESATEESYSGTLGIISRLQRVAIGHQLAGSEDLWPWQELVGLVPLSLG